jgi:hypothetical protein
VIIMLCVPHPCMLRYYCEPRLIVGNRSSSLFSHSLRPSKLLSLSFELSLCILDYEFGPGNVSGFSLL